MKLSLKNDVNVVINNNTKFTYFEILFPFLKNDYSDNYHFEIMKELVSTYSLKNKTIIEFAENNESNYIFSFKADSYTRGNMKFLYFSFYLPGEEFFDDFNLEKSLKVVKNNIFKSILLDREYSEKLFDNIYKRIGKSLSAALSDPKSLFHDMWNELYDFNHIKLHTNSEKINALNSTSLDGVIKFYKELVLKGNYTVLIAGNVSDKDKYIDTFNKVFKRNEVKMEFDVEYHEHFKPDSFGHVDKKVPYSLSIARVSYHKEDYTERDRYLLYMLDDFLMKKENFYLFNNLRLENNLVYSCDSTIYPSFNTITMTAFLSKDNIDKALEIFDNTLVSFKDKELFEKAKERLLKAQSIKLIDTLDRKLYKLSVKRNRLLKLETFEDECEIAKTITYEEFNEFIDALKKDAELIMIGDKND